MTGMTILAAADYLVTPSVDAGLPEDWQTRFAAFMGQSEIRVLKQTKRSEREINIRPLVFEWEARDGGIFVKLAAGSTENLKPDLVMDTFLKDLHPEENIRSHPFIYRRLEMYADMGEEGNRKLVTLESLGEEI